MEGESTSGMTVKNKLTGLMLVLHKFNVGTGVLVYEVLNHELFILVGFPTSLITIFDIGRAVCMGCHEDYGKYGFGSRRISLCRS